MLVSWIQKLSLLDYPDKIACVVFTLGCNLRCHYCHNSEFVLSEKVRQIKNGREQCEQFFQFLETRRWILDGVSICGWEPTIQKNLRDFIIRIRSLWFLVKLDTNGQNPELLRELLGEWLLDYIAMDIKHTWNKYELLVWMKVNTNDYKLSTEIIRSMAPDYEFRTTVISWIHTLYDIEDIARELSWSRRYVLQGFRSGKVLNEDMPMTPPTNGELQEMRELARYYIEQVTIRN